jgi:preprotein translocase subunit SecF
LAIGSRLPKNDTKPKPVEQVTLSDSPYRFNFIKQSKWVTIVSLTIIIIGIILTFTRGFNFGIDFLGGNLMEVKFNKPVPITEVRNVMEEAGYGKAILQGTADDQYIIRTTPISADQKNSILDSLDKKIGIERTLVQDRQVAAGFSKTITRNALIAVAISVAGILIYVWIRFTARFALVAILELLHDLLIILSFYAITYREFNINSTAVILTILGYSLNDGIVIFDRIREELRINRRDDYFELTNYSINKTFVRSLITGTTSLFPIIVILIIGNETLKDFAFGLLLGIISGSYSSIYIGPPVLVAWNNRFPKYKK